MVTGQSKISSYPGFLQDNQKSQATLASSGSVAPKPAVVALEDMLRDTVTAALQQQLPALEEG